MRDVIGALHDAALRKYSQTLKCSPSAACHITKGGTRAEDLILRHPVLPRHPRYRRCATLELPLELPAVCGLPLE